MTRWHRDTRGIETAHSPDRGGCRDCQSRAAPRSAEPSDSLEGHLKLVGSRYCRYSERNPELAQRPVSLRNSTRVARDPIFLASMEVVRIREAVITYLGHTEVGGVRGGFSDVATGYRCTFSDESPHSTDITNWLGLGEFRVWR